MKRYLTEQRKEVTDRVRDERLIIFKSAVDAEKYAIQKRSYSYQVFDLDKQHAGWGVPK